MKKVKKAFIALALTATLALSVIWGTSASQSNFNLMADPQYIQKPGHNALVINTTMSQLKSAAQQLDSTTQSGGPTASQNQKIQELT